MGFGILFTGYFLLLNVTLFSVTDLISALVMALGLYKLSSVNKNFGRALLFSYVFAAVGAVELCGELVRMFDPGVNVELFITLTSIVRYILVAMLTFYILLGIIDLANEVDLPVLKKRGKILIPITFTVYPALAILSVPDVFGNMKVLQIISFSALLLLFVAVIMTLVTIYSAYMHICMPSDNVDTDEKPSRFGFVNKYREHRAEKDAEYARYKLEKMKKGKNKKKK